MKNITSFGSQLSTAVLNLSTSTITHSAKYRLIIGIEKNPENIDISFWSLSHTPTVPTGITI